MPEAVVIAEPQGQESLGQGDARFVPSAAQNFCGFPAGLELLGESVAGRLFHDLDRSGIEKLSLAVDETLADFNPPKKVETSLTSNVWSNALQMLLSAKARGVDAVVLVRLGGYVDINLVEALQFHRDSAETVTRVCDDEYGPLDLWIVDPASFTEGDNLTLRLHDNRSSFNGHRYVNRLETAQDLRRLVVDGLTGRCGFKPYGSEVRPGVWIANGAEVKRGARIVAPVFIGRNVTVSDQCLITRCSNIESNSRIDYGTVVEDSSVLSDTYVGIGLDLSHAIADGVILQNLNYDVTVEITDPVVMGSLRQNKNRGEGSRQRFFRLRRPEDVSATHETM